MALTLYNKKRNFEDTPEPEGKSSKKKSSRFVIQRHEATRLHYDFRLEMDGVLKSWAVPKGPSLNPGDKRLAMMVEDHPVGYIGFEGRIPEGNYGAGTVIVWDKGSYSPVDENHNIITEKQALKNLGDGQLKFSLRGEKLNGEFVLIKLKNDQKGNAWLLIKHRDEFAIDDYNSEDYLPKSVVSSMKKVERTVTSKSKVNKSISPSKKTKIKTIKSSEAVKKKSAK